ncbi:MAG: InlB B-repeat-containing protein, partial [Candidatus Bathyarchaeota archaeon]|nr:InlB B-repeat-containing protein [Candidatus Termiticorpusculum sp.]
MSVKNQTELENAVNVATGPTTIILNNDIKLDSVLEISKNKNITLKSSDSGTNCIYKLFGAPNLATINVKGGGVLQLYDVIVTHEANVAGGCGVFIDFGGKLIMYNGQISGNSPWYDEGGGVCNKGDFIMKGGVITNNDTLDGGGVCNYGNFTMDDGVITNNVVEYNGGGVYNKAGVFKMSGGKISGNTAERGGGIYLGDGSVTLSGSSTLSDNSATIDGGGVWVGKTKLENLCIDSDVAFSNNSAKSACDRHPDQDTVYGNNIHCTIWSDSLAQGYNNYDISHPEGTIRTFSVTINNHAEKSSGAGRYPKGEKVTIYAGTKTGHKFTKWIVKENNIQLDDASKSSTGFVMPACDVDVTANWEPNDYPLTIINESATPVMREETRIYDHEVTINAGLRQDYKFDRWDVMPKGLILSNDPTINFKMPAEAVVVTAKWKPVEYSVVINGNGPSTSGAGDYPHGTDVKISVDTKDGYNFTNWTIKPDNIKLDNDSESSTGFVMPAENVEVTANWKTADFTVVVNSDGATDAKGTGKYSYGNSVTISAGTKPGYNFTGWTINSVGISLSLPDELEVVFTMPAGDVVVTANWERAKFKVDINSVGATNVEGDGTHYYDYEVTIDAGTRLNYFFNGWTINDGGIVLKNVARTTFKMPARPVVVTANWEPNKCPVKVNGSYTTSTLSGEGSYEQGVVVTINVGTRLGYVFDGWDFKPNVNVLSSDPTKFVMPACEVVVTAKWKYTQYSVNVIESYALPASKSGIGTYSPAETVVVCAGTKTGYDFAGWTVTDEDIVLENAASDETSFVMPAKNVVVTANWKPAEFSVMVSSVGASGVEGTGKHVYGKTVTINAGSRTGYVFAGWTVNTGNVSLVNRDSASTSFVMPAGTVEVTANWKVVAYNVTINSVDATGVEGSGKHDYSTDVSIAAGSRTGYIFAGWNVTDKDVVLKDASSFKTSFVMPAKDVTITANWTILTTMTLVTAKNNVNNAVMRVKDPEMQLLLNACVTIAIRGSGSATVNWGDSSSNSYTLSPDSDCVCAHSYTSSVSRTITITGKVTHLQCNGNELTDLNVTGNSLLETLYCSNNLLTSLSVSGLANLRTLYCDSNKLSSLIFSGNPTIEVLSCCRNSLSSLSVSGFSKLYYLACENNSLSSLNVSSNTALQTLSCGNNLLSSLSVSGLSKLSMLHCSSNKLSSLVVGGLLNLKTLECDSNQLTSLNVTGNSALEHLYCRSNKLSSLSVSGLSNLKELHCSSNVLSSLSVSGLSNLTSLYCDSNVLSSLSVSGLSKLTVLCCSGNLLSILDVSSNTAIVTLRCDSNKLSSLSVSGLSNLKTLNCRSNSLSYVALDSLFGSLNSTRPFNELYILSNLGTDGCNVVAATNKGWIVDYKPQSRTMTLTTAKNSVRFILRGLGSATVNWGDNSSNTYALSSGDCVCTHNYASSSTRTITIATNNIITHLDCSGNELSALGVTENTFLETLYCYNNLLSSLSVSGLSKLRYLQCTSNSLSVSALDSLFGLLDSTVTVGVTKSLYIVGNPGAIGCNLSVVT